MSTPQGSREVRNSRGRGRGRGGTRPRERGNDLRDGRRASKPSTATDGPPTQRRDPTNQNDIRNKSWREEGGSASPLQNGNGSIVSNKSMESPAKPRKEDWRNAVLEPYSTYQKNMSDLYQTLKKNREKERRDAIKNGFLADPDRPTSLANAITPVGTCQDMCPEFERVERIVQLMVDGSEKVLSTSGTKVPWEAGMVKRFRRSAAGYDEQLPSDIRPPRVLESTLKYLFEEVIGGPQPLAQVHKFVWDRTRGIRNDFSIQQVTKLDDLKVAIDCFERIARFHILSLHQLSQPGEDSGEFDHHQEREQLNNTLLSLIYYYDDSRSKLTSPNEAEFRAYCILFEIQDQRPDLEDRAQSWPRSLLVDPRVQIALKLYAAAGNVADDQGPLRPRTPFSIAQGNPGRFWALIQSNAVPYLMACVAEIYFNYVRSTALETIWKAYKGRRGGPQKMEDWILADLTPALGFDDQEQTQAYCEDHGFVIAEKESGEAYVDLGSVVGKYLSDSNPRRKQIFSKSLVEPKRLGRTLPAVINGLSASEAQAQGLVEGASLSAASSESSPENLFITGDSDGEPEKAAPGPDISTSEHNSMNNAVKLNSSPNPFTPSSVIFGAPTARADPFASANTFGKPNPLGLPVLQLSNQSVVTDPGSSNPFGQGPAKFDFHNAKPLAATTSHSAIPSPIPAPNKANFSFSSPLNFTANSSSPVFKFPSVSHPPKDESINGVQNASKALAETSKPSPSPFSFPKKADSSSHLVPPTTTTTQPPTLLTSPFNPSIPPKVASTSKASLLASSFTFSNSSTPPTLTAPLLASSFTLLNPLTPPPLPPPANITPTQPQNVLSKPNVPPATEQSEIPSGSFTANKASFIASASTSSSASDQISFSRVPPIVNITTARKPETQKLQAGAKPLSPSLSRPAESSFAPLVHPPHQIKATLSRPDPRPAVLDAITNSLMLDSGGLLNQFVEYTLSNIITDTFRQLEDERSWEKAGEMRVVILSNKYFKKWKKTAWKLGLLRKGKERRKIFANSVRELSKSTRKQKLFTSTTNTSSIDGRDSRPGSGNSANTNMLPPPVPKSKRNSLPTNLKYPQPSLGTASSSKRKREGDLTDAQFRASQRIEHHHKRSKTLSNPISSSTARSGVFSPHSSRLDFSHLGDGSIQSHIMLQKVRQLAPSVKTDTTRTDYFELKSRGIDPDTPVIPRTSRKRHSEDPQPNGIKTRQSLPSDTGTASTSKIPPLKHNPTSSPPISASAPESNDSDEALFAQIRAVRKAMAESITWMRAEREKDERRVSAARSSVQQRSPPCNETAKEKRLRDFKTTPSRTEQRLRTTKANGLLPPDWDGFASFKRGPRNAEGKWETKLRKVVGWDHQTQKPVAEFEDWENGVNDDDDDDDDEEEDKENEEDEQIDEYDEDEKDEYEEEYHEQQYSNRTLPSTSHPGPQGTSIEDAIEL